MVKLYSNENFPLPVVKELRELGQAHRIHEAIESRPQIEGQLIRINRPR